MPNIYYINLDNSYERRSEVEAWFKNGAPPGINLIRVPAVDASLAGSMRNSAISAAQKACILSHIKAIESSLEDGKNSLILEDDAAIGEIGFATINNLLQQNMGDTDIVLTSALISNINFFMTQYVLYRRSYKSKKIEFLDMIGVKFAGTDGYIVNNNSKKKILDLFKNEDPFDFPYDILLGQWIAQTRLKAKCAFPFLSYLSPSADESQITVPNIDWNHFRRLFSIDSHLSIESRISKGLSEQASIKAFTKDYLAALEVFLLNYAVY